MTAPTPAQVSRVLDSTAAQLSEYLDRHPATLAFWRLMGQPEKITPALADLLVAIAEHPERLPAATALLRAAVQVIQSNEIPKAS